ncbi:MAG: hypothetical protein KIT18_03765 [Burkholderiales bacterium]|nr:hypothetical protein [Burkholderiales bacterium]
MTLSHQQHDEQEIFSRFIKRLRTENHWLSICSRPQGEPDLLCVHAKNGPIAFELVSLTDPKIAEIQAAGSNAIETAFVTSDPSERIILRKLQRSYKTTANHIELLIYTDGQIITPDDVIIPTVLPLFDAITHQFKKIWFMGESDPECIWTARQILS